MDIKPKGLIQRVLDFAVSELERRSRPPAPAVHEEPRSAAPATSSSTSSSASEPTQPLVVSPEPKPRAVAGGLHLTRGERGALKVRWAVTTEELSRSAALVDEGAVLCLRVVSFSAGRDHVNREVQDRPSIASHGECEVARSEDGRAVVALGLRAGGRFVSIAHQVV